MFPFGAISTLKGISNDLKLSNTIVSDLALSGNAYAGAKLDSDGNLKKNTNGATWVTVRANEWIADEWHALPGFDPSLYEGGFFGVTGDPLTGGSAEDTYISLDTGPFWYMLLPPGPPEGPYSCSGTLKVREKANPSNEVTCTLSLDVEIG